MQKCAKHAAVAVSLVLASATLARAQLYEDVGTRAQGMAGAFVAVADDSTASWWNPAGLATGALFNLIVEKSRANQPEDPVGVEPARRSSDTSFSLSLPSLGVSYYRLRVSQLPPITSIEAGTANRQDAGDPGVRVRSHLVTQFGVTVGQSLGRHVVVATTMKLVRGGASSALVDGSTDALDVAEELPIGQETHADLDGGVMVSFGAVRFGLSARNLTEPDFAERSSDALTLKRLARAGAAGFFNSRSGFLSFSVSADADLTTSPSPLGEVRHAAVGGEAWLWARHVGLRGGLSTNTIGERRNSTSTGVSVAITRGIYIDGARTFGKDDSIDGWSSTVRFTY